MRLYLYLGFLRALLLTLLIEGAAISLIFKSKKYVYYSILCNLLTNPALNLILWAAVRVFGIDAYYPTLFMAEVTVVVVEAIMYRYICGFGIRKAVLLSAFLNILSFMVGIIINLY